MPLPTVPLAGHHVGRLGYGAMQLPGPGVWGPPADRNAAIAVLRAAVDHGVTHIDTAGFYGPHVADELLREALHPYPADLLIASKVGVVRGPDRSWLPAASPSALVEQVHDNLRRLGLDRLDLVYLRVGGDGLLDHDPTPFEESWGTLADLADKGDIGHLALSGITPGHLPRAEDIAPVAAVQSRFSLFDRSGAAVLAACAAHAWEPLPFVPYFPLGGAGAQRRHPRLTAIADRVEASAEQVALAWLLAQHPAILAIPGTRDAAHLAQNMAADEVRHRLTGLDLAELDAIAIATADA
ncbi:oxidoreductase [Streptomyces sp. NBC_00091]|uniref:oxidoreductase n=1 Tax=Streptomyces sp. NBC_00091 TaxID=2975648 RepID=UPI002258CB5E|nr:oxidoreductase [Streptomyces sp. NBC_00091]MCX5381598.1 oxidoreductase [Streptomyces sp. NBC_00091]